MPHLDAARREIDVSDHAVLRWLERVCGVDVEAYREAIREAVTAGGVVGVDLPGDAGIYIDVPGERVHLLLRSAQVITVFNYDRDPD